MIDRVARRHGEIPEAAAAFCEQQYPQLTRILSLYCGDRHLAEELAQEALMKACRDWRKVEAMEHAGAWVHRVALNLANSHFRRRAAEKRALTRVHPRVVDAEPDTATALAVRAAVASLPQRQKAVLVLHYFADLTFPQVAELLDMPENTVKSLGRRAVASLRVTSAADQLEEVRDGT